MESKRRFGDRKDGRLMRELDSLHYVTVLQVHALHHAHEERRLQSV